MTNPSFSLIAAAKHLDTVIDAFASSHIILSLCILHSKKSCYTCAHKYIKSLTILQHLQYCDTVLNYHYFIKTYLKDLWKQRERENSPILWFTPLMTTMAEAKPG